MAQWYKRPILIGLAATAVLVVYWQLFRVDVPSNYDPGRLYVRREPIDITAGNLTSGQKLEPVHYFSLGYCRKSMDGTNSDIPPYKTLYSVQIRYLEWCRVVCKRTLELDHVVDFKKMVDGDYRVNLALHALPVVTVSTEGGVKKYKKGFPVGYKEKEGGEDKYLLYNHLKFNIVYYHDPKTDYHKILAFEVEPWSVKHEYDGDWNNRHPSLTTCDPEKQLFPTEKSPKQVIDDGAEVIFTFNVEFEESKDAEAPKGYPS